MVHLGDEEYAIALTSPSRARLVLPNDRRRTLPKCRLPSCRVKYRAQRLGVAKAREYEIVLAMARRDPADPIVKRAIPFPGIGFCAAAGPVSKPEQANAPPTGRIDEPEVFELANYDRRGSPRWPRTTGKVVATPVNAGIHADRVCIEFSTLPVRSRSTQRREFRSHSF